MTRNLWSILSELRTKFGLGRPNEDYIGFWGALLRDILQILSMAQVVPVQKVSERSSEKLSNYSAAYTVGPEMPILPIVGIDLCTVFMQRVRA